MNRKHRCDLVKIISNDLLHHSKIQLMLFFLVLISAILVVVVTNHTRCLTFKREQIALEKNTLDIEWRKLTLEENALGDHSRIERIAIEKLQMHHIDPSQENIIVQF